jgi:hypothetical protein
MAKGQREEWYLDMWLRGDFTQRRVDAPEVASASEYRLGWKQGVAAGHQFLAGVQVVGHGDKHHGAQARVVILRWVILLIQDVRGCANDELSRLVHNVAEETAIRIEGEVVLKDLASCDVKLGLDEAVKPEIHGDARLSVAVVIVDVRIVRVNRERQVGIAVDTDKGWGESATLQYLSNIRQPKTFGA